MRKILLAVLAAWGVTAAPAAATTETIGPVTRSGVALDTTVAAGAVRTLKKDSVLLPLSLAGWYGDSGSGSRWTLTQRVGDGAAETLATGRDLTDYVWAPDTVGTTVLTLTAADGTTRKATFEADVYYVKGEAAQDLTAPEAGQTVTTTLTLEGVALDTTVPAGQTRVLTKDSVLMPLSLAGWYGKSGAGATWSLAGKVNDGAAAAMADGAADTLYDWTPDIGTTVLTLTAADNTTLTATFTADTYFVDGAQDLTTGGTDTVSVTMTYDGVALDTRTTGAVRTLASPAEVLPIAWSGDNWAGEGVAASASVTVTAPAGGASTDAKAGEGTFDLAASIGTWTLKHTAGTAVETASLDITVPGGGTTAVPFQLTAATGFVDGLKSGDYVTVTPAAAYEAVAVQAKEDHFVLVPRGSQHQVLADTTTFTATWLNDDGTTADATEVTVYGTPAHDALAKEADAQYTYAFETWSPAPEAIVSNTSYKAVFTATVRSYAVKFVDENGTVLQEETLDYGATPAYRGATPVKAETAEFTYTFKGWDNPVATVTGAATYTAVYTATRRSYTITWQDYNDQTIDTTTVEYGQMPTHADAVRAATAEYSYPFAGWTPALTTVTGPATYTATHTETPNEYTLTFVFFDDNKTSQQVAYGAAVTAPAAPDRGEWYEFLGWDKSVPATMPAEDLTVTALWKKYASLSASDTFANVALDTTVATGAVRVVASVEDILPVTHAGDGWTKKAADAKATVKTVAPKGPETSTDYTGDGTAAFAPDAIGTWTLTHTAADGATETAYIALTVKGAGTDAAPYALTADTGFVDGVVANDYVAVPTAAFDAVETAAAAKNLVLVPRGENYLVLADSATFTITWKNDDGTVIDTTPVKVFTTPEHAKPTKASTAQYDYTFTGWTPALVAVTDDATYTAVFEATTRSYTVTFANEDGTELQSGVLKYGEMPSYTGDTPAKASTAQYDYTFAGWNNAITMVTGEATYTATFTETVRTYEITWKDWDDTVIGTTTVAYGTMPTHEDATRDATAEYTYAFAGWTPTPVEVTGAADYTATYTKTPNTYTLTWLLGDEQGTVVASETLAYGAAVTAPAKPDRGEWYVFLNWSETPATMPAGDLTITALWEKKAALVYDATAQGIALDTRVAEGETHVIAKADEILPFAASGANFKRATTKGAWTIAADHLGKAEDVGAGNVETTVEWTPSYMGLTTVKLTAARSADYTLEASFQIGEEAAETADAGDIDTAGETDTVTVTVEVVNVPLDTRVAENAVHTVTNKAEVLPFALSGDAFTGTDAAAAYAVTLAVDGGAAADWATGAGDARKTWAADVAGRSVFTHTAADGTKLAATFEIEARVASDGASDELDESGTATVTVAVTKTDVAVDTRKAKGETRTFATQEALEAELLPFTYSGRNWTGSAGTAVVTVDDNGTVSTFVTATAEDGTRRWTPQGAGTYVFTHTAGGAKETATFVIAGDLAYPVDADGGASWLYVSVDPADAGEWGYAGEEYGDYAEAVRQAQTGDITDIAVDDGCVVLTFRVRLTETASEEGSLADWAYRSITGGKLKVLTRTDLTGGWDAAASADLAELTPDDFEADDLTVSVAVPFEAPTAGKAFFKVIVTD